MKNEPFEQYMPEYDAWFEQHGWVYAAELQAVRTLLPTSGVGMEIGIGTGRFAAPLGITIGIEPARYAAGGSRTRALSAEGRGGSAAFSRCAV